MGAPAVFQIAAGAGYWVPSVVVVPSVSAGAVATVQVRAWETGRGSTFEQARAAGGRFGQSLQFSVTTGGTTDGGTAPPSFPAYLIGLQSFSLVPEPSCLALLGVAGLVLALRQMNRVRRRCFRS